MEARRPDPAAGHLVSGRAWLLAVGTAFLTFFLYPGAGRFLPPSPPLGPPRFPAVRGSVSAVGTGAIVAIAFLLALSLVVPIAALATIQEAHLFTTVTRGQLALELFHRLELAKQATNAQLWWALLAALPVCWWLRRFTRAPVFSLMFATYAALLCLATLLRLGMLDWARPRPWPFLPPPAPLRAAVPDRRLRLRNACACRTIPRYFYPFAVAFTWAALSGVAACTNHTPGGRTRWRPGRAARYRVPVHRQRRHLLHARPGLRAAILSATAHRGHCLFDSSFRPRK